MKLFRWFDRQKRLEQRKQKLGERITSDLSWRIFSTELLFRLNPALEPDSVKHIYEIGWCGGKEDVFNKLKQLIQYQKINSITGLNDTIEQERDALGYAPVGDYLKTYLWEMKGSRTFVQVIKGSFDVPGEEIVFQRDIDPMDITRIDQRKLIYPV